MILQGYDLTTAKYKANLYQKRMMLAVVSAAQSKIDGVRHIAGQRFKIEEGEFPIISVPIDLILQDDDSSNIFAVRKAAKDFIGRVIEYQAADGSWVVFSQGRGHWQGKYGNPEPPCPYIVFDWYDHSTGKSIKTTSLGRHRDADDLCRSPRHGARGLQPK